VKQPYVVVSKCFYWVYVHLIPPWVSMRLSRHFLFGGFSTVKTFVSITLFK